MAELTPLFVPMDVKALVVNDKVRNEQEFRRPSMGYDALNSYNSPEPDPFDQDINGAWNDRNKSDGINGIYLHWQLPSALRQGQLDSQSEQLDFPLVPNRWLVVRCSGKGSARKACAWVVESDYLDNEKGTSPFLTPTPGSITPTRIGRKLDLANWQDGGTSQPLFLTAVGTGDVTFSLFQNNVQDVFSIYDPVLDVADKDELSYFVAGWYSDKQQDFLVKGCLSIPLAEFMTEAGWQIPASALETHFDCSLYHGFLHGIEWHPEGKVPESDRPTKNENIALSVADNSIDAFTCLLYQWLKQQGKGDENAVWLLEALQYNMLPQLNEANGKEQLYQKVQKSWFHSLRGGFEYVVVLKAGLKLKPHELPPEPEWLAELNQQQAEFDRSLWHLKQLQWRLYSMWWSKGTFAELSAHERDRFDLKNSDFDNELNLENPDSLASQVKKQVQKVMQLAARLPFGRTAEALQDSIDQYAQGLGLPDCYELKQINAQSFHLPNDPVVMLSGIKGDNSLLQQGLLQCRTTDQLINSLNANDKTIDAKAIGKIAPKLDTSILPVPVEGLLTEFFLLDWGNAAALAKQAWGKDDQASQDKMQQLIQQPNNLGGSPPDLALEKWRQPWQPLFLLWQIEYFPISHGPEESGNWQFDGMRYKWNGKGAGADQDKRIFSGRTLLTPNSGFNLQHRIMEFLEKQPGLNLEENEKLEAFIEAAGEWDFLSQTLDGLTSNLALRLVESHRIPNKDKTEYEDQDNLKNEAELAQLIAGQNSMVPNLGAAPKRNSYPNSGFQEFRSGQLMFTRLCVVDRFGQTVDVATEGTAPSLRPVLPPTFKPEDTMTGDLHRMVELSPRLLQAARLNFDFVSSRNDNQLINQASEVNPICAWIIPNHLDRAFTCYDNVGHTLGQLLTMTVEGERKVVWQGAPQGDYLGLEDVKRDFGHLGAFLEGLIKQGADVFETVFTAIDSTLWNIDPLGARDDANLSLWMGRPLALVRARLQYELMGEPQGDVSWKYHFEPHVPEFINYNFPVCLGQLRMRNDGLIGYFLNDNYDQLNVVNPPQNWQLDYVKTIKTGNFVDLHIRDKEQQFVTMLMDPRATVHATTGILPIVNVQLPDKFIDNAFSNMEFDVRIDPLLSNLNEEDELLLPFPAERKGNWSLLAPQAGNWQAYELKASSQNAETSNDQSQLRSGFLKLRNRHKV